MQFAKNTSSGKRVFRLIIKISLFLVIVLGIIFLLNKIDLPAPKKIIEKIIPNENFKIVK
jgi:hypothetical protein